MSGGPRPIISRNSSASRNLFMPKSVQQIAAGTKPVPGQPVAEVDIELGDRKGMLTTKSLNIRTMEQALAISKVDLKVWEVERCKVNSWEVTIGRKNNDGATPGTYTNYQVCIWLRRKTPTVLETAFENLLRNLKKVSPPAPLIKLPKTGERFMLEVSLFDAHFGLLAWNRETGDDYDLKLAEASYAETMEDLLAKTVGCRPEKILLPFGNDFFHVNNPEGLTPMAHNILDVDGRLCKVIETGERALIRAVERCLKIAPVHILWIPGNHDPETSYFMCRILQAHFHDNPNVLVDVEPPPRKYLQYGSNLIGFTHGNQEKHADLPRIMADENKKIWGGIKFSEWHTGHFHKEKETRFLAADSYGSTSVLVLPSISGTDAWHFGKGYVKGKRMAVSFLWNHAGGKVATYYSENLRSKS